MASRGAVLAARRRLGFGASGKPEHFLVLQADLFARTTKALQSEIEGRRSGLG